MKRSIIAIVSVLLTYGVCAVSGVNRWMYIWLKGFYPTFVACLWIILALLLSIFAVKSGVPRRRWIVAGAVAGYISGVVAYQIGPALRDGSLVRAASTIRTNGMFSYIGMSLAYPLLILTWLPGIIAAILLTTMARRIGGRYIALGVVAVVVIAGWTFFLMRGVVPLKW
jgi:hypothetical protein